VELIFAGSREKIDLAGTSLYINLLPCPICARMLVRSPIGTIVYQHDHSDGYGFKLLKQAGEKVKRLNNLAFFHLSAIFSNVNH